ncbi:peptidyl-tRNA hydrolase PTH2-domain-containing protein [Lentinula detonsa]|uniref:peptidyl-tRNA hydrolase n=1 Tax=Lentinula detonsa TaxID=2804962 RepID=A0A9W8PA55_9AGAR|nr:peptidyl-tRNA hydrolase PTH2-domain-containing protein [Lentinula detonsa]
MQNGPRCANRFEHVHRENRGTVSSIYDNRESFAFRFSRTFRCSHATLACYKTLLSSNPAFLRQWERTGQTKIALKCYSEEELLTLQAQAHWSLNLCARSIQDAGRTQIAAGSRTVLGIAGKCIWICYFLYMQSLSFHTRVGQIGEQDYWNTATALNLF